MSAAIHHVLLMYGQSNNRGASSDPPVGVPDSRIRLWRHSTNAADFNITDTALVDLQTTETTVPHHGLELQVGVDLIAAGLGGRVTILKVSRGGALLTEIIPGTATYTAFRAVLSAGRPAAAPGLLKVALVMNQGESEATAGTEAPALAWGTNFGTFHTNLEARVGLDIPKIIIRTRDILPDGNWAATVRSQQASVADYLINRDDTDVDGGEIHDTGEAQNIIGGRVSSVLINQLGWAA